MKAVIIQKFGKPEELRLTDVKKPDINEDLLLIRVVAAGLNPVDTKIRSGTHLSCQSLQLPAILGKDMSGIIEQKGRNVHDFKVGDFVFGCVDKSYAEYVTVNPLSIVKKPDNVSFNEAAAVSLAGLTAYQAIYDHLKVIGGEKVLIQSAAGGVGHLAVQFAKLNGAFVYGTASGKNAGFLKELGVDKFINYKEEQFEEIATDLDAVLDTMGADVLYRSIKCVKPGGRIVCLPSSTRDDPKAIALAKERNVVLVWPMMQPDQETLQKISSLMEKKQLKVKIDKVFPLTGIIQAHQVVESHGVSGKIVVQISS